MFNKITISTLFVSLLAVAGCADTGTNDAGQNQAQASAASGGSAPVAGAVAAANGAVQQLPVADPSLIVFEPGNAALDDNAWANISQMADPAKQAARVILTGYSDPSVSKNAKQLALARAVAVRNALHKNGVILKKMHIRYITTQARNEVTIELIPRH